MQQLAIRLVFDEFEAPEDRGGHGLVSLMRKLIHNRDVQHRHFKAEVDRLFRGRWNPGYAEANAKGAVDSVIREWIVWFQNFQRSYDVISVDILHLYQILRINVTAMWYNEQIGDVVEVLSWAGRIRAQGQTNDNLELSLVVSVPFVARMWQEWRPVEQGHGVDGVTVLVRRDQLALEAFTLVEVEELLLVFQARCARNYLEIPEKEHFLTIDQLNRRSHFADIRQLFVEFEAHFFSRLAVQEEHYLPTAVYKGAIILIFAQENELLKVAVYLWKALPNFIDRFPLVCGLLDYGVLVDGQKVSDMVVEVQAEVRDRLFTSVKIGISTFESFSRLNQIHFAANLHVESAWVAFVHEYRKNILEVDVNLKIILIQRVGRK